MTLLARCFLALAMVLPVAGQDAEAIMKNVRQITALQDNLSLNGQVRGPRGKVPVTLFLQGGNIQFALDGGKERFHLRMNENDADLLEFREGAWKNFPPAKLVQPIAASDLTYEDLALRFLYWKNPRIVGEETLKGQKCWRIHVQNPNQKGRYKEISVWVAQKFSALMRVTAYDARRQPVKQFEITDVMKVNDLYTVEKMKVSSIQGGRFTSHTYLEFDKPKAMAQPRR